MDQGRDRRMTRMSAATAGVALAVDTFLGGGFHLGLVTPDFLVRLEGKISLDV